MCFVPNVVMVGENTFGKMLFKKLFVTRRRQTLFVWWRDVIESFLEICGEARRHFSTESFREIFLMSRLRPLKFLIVP